MSQFAWVMLAIGIFVLGQWMMMRPNARESGLMHLREAARKRGLQPRLLPAPTWLVQEHRKMVPVYTLIVPNAVMPYWRAQWAEGRLQTVTPGLDRLAQLTPPDSVKLVLAIEAQANAVSFYWEEEAGEQVLDELKAFLLALASAS